MTTTTTTVRHYNSKQTHCPSVDRPSSLTKGRELAAGWASDTESTKTSRTIPWSRSSGRVRELTAARERRVQRNLPSPRRIHTVLTMTHAIVTRDSCRSTFATMPLAVVVLLLLMVVVNSRQAASCEFRRQITTWRGNVHEAIRQSSHRAKPRARRKSTVSNCRTCTLCTHQSERELVSRTAWSQRQRRAYTHFSPAIQTARDDRDSNSANAARDAILQPVNNTRTGRAGQVRSLPRNSPPTRGECPLFAIKHGALRSAFTWERQTLGEARQRANAVLLLSLSLCVSRTVCLCSARSRSRTDSSCVFFRKTRLPGTVNIYTNQSVARARRILANTWRRLLFVWSTTTCDNATGKQSGTARHNVLNGTARCGLRRLTGARSALPPLF